MLNWTSEKPPAEISLQLKLALVLILPLELTLSLPLPPTLLLPPALELPLTLSLTEEEAGRKDSTHGRNGCAKSAADGAVASPDKEDDIPPALLLPNEDGDKNDDEEDDDNDADDADGEAAGRTRCVIAGTTSPSAPAAMYTSSPIVDWKTASVTNRTRISSSCVCASSSWMRLRRQCQRRRMK
jgi:hypothetical protein